MKTATRDARTNTGHQVKTSVTALLWCLCACATINVQIPHRLCLHPRFAMVELVYVVQGVPEVVVILTAHKSLRVDINFVSPSVLLICANVSTLVKAGLQNCKQLCLIIINLNSAMQ